MRKWDRSIGLAILAVAVFLILWPEVREGTASPCQALADSRLRPHESGNDLANAFISSLGAAMLEARLARKYPGYPVSLMCLARYYQQ
jgi:hypothetical protein